MSCVQERQPLWVWVATLVGRHTHCADHEGAPPEPSTPSARFRIPLCSSWIGTHFIADCVVYGLFRAILVDRQVMLDFVPPAPPSISSPAQSSSDTAILYISSQLGACSVLAHQCCLIRDTSKPLDGFGVGQRLLPNTCEPSYHGLALGLG